MRLIVFAIDNDCDHDAIVKTLASIPECRKGLSKIHVLDPEDLETHEGDELTEVQITRAINAITRIVSTTDNRAQQIKQFWDAVVTGNIPKEIIDLLTADDLKIKTYVKSILTSRGLSFLYAQLLGAKLAR